MLWKHIINGYIEKFHFNRRYVMEEEIGRGSYSVVYSATRVKDEETVAVKQIFKSKLTASNYVGDTLLEVVMLNQLWDVPGVIRLLDHYELKNSICLILERDPSYRDLFEYVKTYRSLDEESARIIFKQLIYTLKLCHFRGIFHGDIKSENILVHTGTLKTKLIDFNSCTAYKPGYYVKFKGTEVYAPPEWLTDGKFTADGLTVWCLGVLLHDMVTGNIPFKNKREILEKKLNCMFLSPPLRDLITSCLTRDPDQRIGFQQLHSHEWLSMGIER